MERVRLVTRHRDLETPITDGTSVQVYAWLFESD